MSMHLNFEPHSWYMGFAIKREQLDTGEAIGVRGHSLAGTRKRSSLWSAYTDDGNTYRIVDLEAHTLKRLKQKIRRYHLRKHNGYGERIAKRRLEQLRIELRAERISTDELAELQGLSNYIDKGDVELLEPAGVPEQ